MFLINRGSYLIITFGIIFSFCNAFAKNASEVFAQNSESIISIYSKTPKGIYAGSGVVIQKNLIVTNCHVIKDANQIYINLHNKKIDARLVKGSEFIDMCLIMASIPDISPAKISNRSILVGEQIITIGNPKGLDKTLSDGLVSSKRELGNGLRYIQISAPITFGSSGGGLFDMEGYLIGITISGFEKGNLNFALPIDYLDTLKDIPIKKPNQKQRSLVDDVTADAIKTALSRREELFELPKLSSAEKNEFEQFLSIQMIALQQKIKIDEERQLLIKAVWYESRRAGLEPNLILGLIEVVSNFDQFFTSKFNRRGFMSVPDDALKNVGIDRNPALLFDRRVNLRAGCTLLRKYVDFNNGDLYGALNQYVDNVDKNFPNKVRNAWRKYDEMN